MPDPVTSADLVEVRIETVDKCVNVRDLRSRERRSESVRDYVKRLLNTAAYLIDEQLALCEQPAVEAKKPPIEVPPPQQQDNQAPDALTTEGSPAPPIVNNWLARQEAALDQSIAHWSRLAAGTSYADEGITSTDCPLCQINTSCDSCIVAIRTGAKQCRNTPYTAVVMAKSQWSGYDYPADFDVTGYKADLEFLRAAKGMEDCLRQVKEGRNAGSK